MESGVVEVTAHGQKRKCDPVLNSRRGKELTSPLPRTVRNWTTSPATRSHKAPSRRHAYQQNGRLPCTRNSTFVRSTMAGI